ncbi:MAG TPA: dTDP-glucose 4,6-dehydratase, partial [Dehalococcoidia bacterium]|nr:dTDP-glucose 4,6-dehydratase [Dehalococcoidia bacterium]
LDKLTYAGNRENLREFEDDKRYTFVHGDICDPATVASAIEGAWGVVNLAAETHVDRSLQDANVFIQTDVYGAYVMLEAARQHGVQRFLHVSTDEVYGPRFPDNPGRESDALTPANPYSASKAGGEQMCLAYCRTYDLPVIVSRSANNIGPYQHPEKVVPLFVTNALHDQPLPLYGEGKQVRDRLYVEDNCEALDLLLHKGVPGEVYNVGSVDNERTNLEVAETILGLLEKSPSLIRFVADRPGHDGRYSLDTSKIRALGWQPRHDYQSTIGKTVAWYLQNREWWEKIKARGDYRDYYLKQYTDRLSQSHGL